MNWEWKGGSWVRQCMDPEARDDLAITIARRISFNGALPLSTRYLRSIQTEDHLRDYGVGRRARDGRAEPLWRKRLTNSAKKAGDSATRSTDQRMESLVLTCVKGSY